MSERHPLTVNQLEEQSSVKFRTEKRGLENVIAKVTSLYQTTHLPSYWVQASLIDRTSGDVSMGLYNRDGDYIQF